MKAYEFTVTGLVQGVGYRPYIAEMFSDLGYDGTVRNAGGIVKIELAVSEKAVEDIIHRLYKYFPEGAVVENVSCRESASKISKGFVIIESNDENIIPLLPIDIPVCEKCLLEMKDKNNRRYRYPFISCAACGPRYTIMYKTPYDRENTTMNKFGMCPECEKEYNSFGDRRHYAQTIGCNNCGPVLKLFSGSASEELIGEEAFIKAVDLIKQGEVIAIKDTGGYHLVCNAYDDRAVGKLRSLKHREKKPFAIMVKDEITAKKFAFVSSAEEQLLLSKARPIVLLDTIIDNKIDGSYYGKNLKENSNALSNQVNLTSPYVGIMLPSNGLQHMLSEEFEALVMTSANISGEPIIIDDEEIKKFENISILYNDREILTPLDDSIVRNICGKNQVLRRGRGYVPEPVESFETGNSFASGADMKSGFAFSSGNRVFLSQSFGDLQSLRVETEYRKAEKYIRATSRFNPEKYICDAHPGYISSKLHKQSQEKVYHHAAHAFSVIAEHKITEGVLAFVFDGTGYGENGSVWGGEVFAGNLDKLERVAHLEESTLVGGDESSKSAINSFAAFMNGSEVDLTELLEKKITKDKKSVDEEIGDTGLVVKSKVEADELNVELSKIEMIQKGLNFGINTVKSSSMGRLFDAAAYALGICDYNGYEGQCPCELEYEAATTQEYCKLILPVVEEKCVTNKNNILCDDTKELMGDVQTLLAVDTMALTGDTKFLIEQLVKYRLSGEEVNKIARGFIYAIADWVLNIANKLDKNHEKCIVLSGGCFANKILLERTVELLEGAGFRVFFNELVPPGDDGIALGQIIMKRG